MNTIDTYRDITFPFLYSPSLYIHIIPIKYLLLLQLECTLKATHTYTKAAVAIYVS